MNTSASMRLRAGERAHASNEDLAFVTNRLHALQDENAMLATSGGGTDPP